MIASEGEGRKGGGGGFRRGALGNQPTGRPPTTLGRRPPDRDSGGAVSAFLADDCAARGGFPAQVAESSPSGAAPPTGGHSFSRSCSISWSRVRKIVFPSSESRIASTFSWHTAHTGRAPL